MPPNCRWILANGSYCEKPVKYRYEKEPFGDDIKRRVYDTFCPEHKKKASFSQKAGEEFNEPDE